MFSTVMLVLTFVLLIGTFFLTAVNNAFRRLHKNDAEKQFRTLGYRFFYRPFHLYFFPNHEYEGLFFATICAQNITRFCYTAAALIFVSQMESFHHVVFGTANKLDWISLISSLLGFAIAAFIVGDYLARVLGMRYPETILRLCTPISSIFMYLVFPITYFFLKITQSLPRPIYLDPFAESMGTDEIIDLLQRISPSFDTHDRKLIESVVTFKERIAREVMIPRVDVFSLPADMPIKEAAKQLEREGYSRIPIYHSTVDNIVGVLMYKDVLSKYIEYQQKGNDSKVLDAPIESIQKGVLHTPETKKISSLLQEFRKKQVHLAIVVDEYGGTAGIVTIEDILEEIVGDISDEYDQQEEELYHAQSDGSWIVDARMGILDLEEELGIEIPQEGEYDTIGGYIYHTTGMIPSKGFVIHQDNFVMEILKSNDRSVETVRIRPILNSDSRDENSLRDES